MLIDLFKKKNKEEENTKTKSSRMVRIEKMEENLKFGIAKTTSTNL